MNKQPKFDLKDIAIIPAIISKIDSRNECNVFNEDRMLPLMAAPMDTVVCSKNLKKMFNEHIIPCMPRGKRFKYWEEHRFRDLFYFQSFGLSEIEDQLREYQNGNVNSLSKEYFYSYNNILIDIANGHMERLLDVLKGIKKEFPDIKVMVGNVAHPLTYKNLAMAGADYVRISIGSGTGCTTAANVAINYPMGSLISECYKIKKDSDLKTKIVADGGMQGYDDIIKALALGADYIMIGSLFNKAIESAGFNYLYGVKIPFHIAKYLWKWKLPVKKKYRGMSTKSVQRGWGKTKIVTAEGITKYHRVKYTLSQWNENFMDYLKSNMSYCGVDNLNDFIGNVEWEYITSNALKRFQK